MSSRGDIKILGDGYVIWCSWCKASKNITKDCDYCFRTETIPAKEWRIDENIQ